MRTRVDVSCRIVAVVAALLVAGGCGSSSGPSLSGFGLGSGRMLSVGDTVDLRLPLNDDGTRQWRVTSYDSLYLTISGSPRVVEDGRGGYEMLIPARARTPGETEIEVTEMTRGRQAPRQKLFKVTILQ